jgi:hypothetical protein
MAIVRMTYSDNIHEPENKFRNFHFWSAHLVSEMLWRKRAVAHFGNATAVCTL